MLKSLIENQINQINAVNTAFWLKIIISYSSQKEDNYEKKRWFYKLYKMSLLIKPKIQYQH